MRRYSPYILFLLLAVFVTILYANGFGPLDSAQQSLNDYLCRFTADDGLRPNVAMVTIDDRAREQHGDWPWNRDLIADLVAATAAGEPKAIVVNLDLTEDTDQDTAGYTGILAGQLSWIDNVVLPYDIALANFRTSATSNPDYLFNYSVTVENRLGLMSEEATPIARKVFLPSEKLLETKPMLGFDYVQPDEDRVIRHQPLLVHYDGYYYPSIALAAAAAWYDVDLSQVTVAEGREIRIGNVCTVPINGASEYFVNFPPDGSFRKFSAATVLSEDFNRELFKNQVIIVGLESSNSHEVFTTPMTSNADRLAIRASIIENLINRNFLDTRSAGGPINLLVLLVIGAACAALLPRVSLMHRYVILFVGMIILANANYFLFSSFKMVPDTIYIALELLLFMIAAPMLDTELIRGEQPESFKRPDLQAAANARSAADVRKTDPAELERVKVRELREDENENQRTVQLDTRPAQSSEPAEKTEAVPMDHQAINIDEDMSDDAPEDSKQPEPSKELDKAIDADEPITADSGSESDKSDEPDIISGDRTLDDDLLITPLDLDDEEPVEDESKSQTTAAEADSKSEDDPAIEPIDLNETPAGGVPSKLGRYEISGTLGKGAMGQVYKGIDPAINRPVALKTIRLDFVNDPEEMAELKERLHREAQAAGKLSHPNIVGIYDVGSEGALQYIVMEYLEGRTLEDMIKKKTQFNYRILAEIIIQICSALQYAHECNIVHRDIKPANIMVLKDYRVKVMDYGIARIDTSSMTKTGIAMGTPNYISPEQLKGQKSDHRADIFSLGVVMYEMLLGRRPFKGENITSLIYSIINSDPFRPSDISPQIPLLFDHIIMKALQKDPAKRYQKASEIAVDLKDFAESFASGS